MTHHLSDVRDDVGASSVEYAVLVAGLAALVVAVVLLLGGITRDSLEESCDTVSSGGGATSATC